MEHVEDQQQGNLEAKVVTIKTSKMMMMSMMKLKVFVCLASAISVIQCVPFADSREAMYDEDYEAMVSDVGAGMEGDEAMLAAIDGADRYRGPYKGGPRGRPYHGPYGGYRARHGPVGGDWNKNMNRVNIIKLPSTKTPIIQPVDISPTAEAAPSIEVKQPESVPTTVTQFLENTVYCTTTTTVPTLVTVLDTQYVTCTSTVFDTKIVRQVETAYLEAKREVLEETVTTTEVQTQYCPTTVKMPEVAVTETITTCVTEMVTSWLPCPSPSVEARQQVSYSY